MQIKNRIINYFVLEPQTQGASPTVMRSKVTMPSSEVLQELQNQAKKKKERPPRGKLLHVCFDVDSNLIYIPNANEFDKQRMDGLLKAAQIRIVKDFGEYSSRPPIEGSPFSSIRVRYISSFSNAKKVIQDHYKGKVFNDLPVIEANLSRMPSTLKTLPAVFSQHEEFWGGYIGTADASSIRFVDEVDISGKKRKEKIMLLDQKTPFILINNSNASKVQPTEKEWVVLSSYRDYLSKDAANEEGYILEDIDQFSDLFAVKRLLYLGWPFEEACSYFMRAVSNFGELIKTVQRLMTAVESLTAENYKDPAEFPFYMTFRIDLETFPINLSSIMDMTTGKINPFRQFKYFRVLDYDPKTQYIIIESQVFVPPNICEKVLRAKSAPFISQYNPVSNTIDAKCEAAAWKDLSGHRNKLQKSKIEALSKYNIDPEKAKGVQFRVSPEAAGEWAVNPMIFHTRHISEYLYAFDHIIKMCQTRNIEFKDLDVIIGPIQQLFGAGTKGGYMNREQFVEKGKPVPFEITAGVWVNPPAIFIDSTEMPNYAEQTSTLVHEYSHNLFNIEHPDHKKGYGEFKGAQGTPEYYEEWYNYLTDPDEREAHKWHIKFELMLGRSVPEIVKDKVGDKITTVNLPIAAKFHELVMEAMNELQNSEEANEEPVGANQ